MNEFPQNKPGEKQNWVRELLWFSLLLTLLAYLPLSNNQFVDWDDSNYIQFNPHIRQLNLASVRWLFTNFYGGYWIPLTWASLSVDYCVGRLEPWIYHLNNLLLHLLNTAIVFLLSLKLLDIAGKKMGKIGQPAWALPAAFGTALLFGLHPIHVESVAWAAERKDLLCGLFFLLSLWAYLAFTAQSSRVKYLTCLGLFSLALLSKPMAISLPFVFVLLDYWPLGRFPPKPSKTWLEKVPFFILAISSSVVAVLSQTQAGAAWGLNASPLSFRLINACHSLLFYLAKMAFPVKLTAFYPILLENTFSPEYLGSLLGVVIISMICFRYREKRPYLAATWLYYLITLVPVLGLFQVGNQAAADRFTYLPSLGPFLLVAGALSTFYSKRRFMVVTLGIIWTGLLGVGTFQQVSVWKDSIALWENVLRFYPRNNLIVHNNLGRAYEQAGRYDQALAKYEDAKANGVSFFYSHWGKARILADKNLLGDSIREYQAALAENPNFPPLHSGLGLVYGRKGLRKEALVEAQEAIRIDPHFGEAYNDLGKVYRDQGQLKEALAAFQKAQSLDPDNPIYMRNLMTSYQKAGRYKETLVLYKQLSAHPRSLLTMSF